jgi:hypothetical protein
VDELLARLDEAPARAIYPLTPAERGLLLNAFDELSQALRSFTFPGSPDAFASTDGGCTEVILVDEHVQQARRVLGYEAPERRSALAHVPRVKS